jgi:hypothetical protein
MTSETQTIHKMFVDIQQILENVWQNGPPQGRRIKGTVPCDFHNRFFRQSASPSPNRHAMERFQILSNCSLRYSVLPIPRRCEQYRQCS